MRRPWPTGGLLRQMGGGTPWTITKKNYNIAVRRVNITKLFFETKATVLCVGLGLRLGTHPHYLCVSTRNVRKKSSTHILLIFTRVPPNFEVTVTRGFVGCNKCVRVSAVELTCTRQFIKTRETSYMVNFQ